MIHYSTTPRLYSYVTFIVRYLIIFFIITLLSSGSLSGQELEIKKGQSVTTESEDTTRAGGPDIDIKVSREYDENGSLIAYDSSYSYMYTFPEKENFFYPDSIPGYFKPFSTFDFLDIFSRSMQGLFYDLYTGFDSFERNFIYNDTISRLEIFNDDFFPFFEKEVLIEMESLKNNFYQLFRDIFKDPDKD